MEDAIPIFILPTGWRMMCSRITEFQANTGSCSLCSEIVVGAIRCNPKQLLIDGHKCFQHHCVKKVKDKIRNILTG
jgi:hypothetical protein